MKKSIQKESIKDVIDIGISFFANIPGYVDDSKDIPGFDLSDFVKKSDENLLEVTQVSENLIIVKAVSPEIEDTNNNNVLSNKNINHCNNLENIRYTDGNVVADTDMNGVISFGIYPDNVLTESVLSSEEASRDYIDENDIYTGIFDTGINEDYSEIVESGAGDENDYDEIIEEEISIEDNEEDYDSEYEIYEEDDESAVDEEYEIIEEVEDDEIYEPDDSTQEAPALTEEQTSFADDVLSINEADILDEVLMPEEEPVVQEQDEIGIDEPEETEEEVEVDEGYEPDDSTQEAPALTEEQTSFADDVLSINEADILDEVLMQEEEPEVQEQTEIGIDEQEETEEEVEDDEIYEPDDSTQEAPALTEEQTSFADDVLSINEADILDEVLMPEEEPEIQEQTEIGIDEQEETEEEVEDDEIYEPDDSTQEAPALTEEQTSFADDILSLTETDIPYSVFMNEEEIEPKEQEKNILDSDVQNKKKSEPVKEIYNPVNFESIENMLLGNIGEAGLFLPCDNMVFDISEINAAETLTENIAQKVSGNETKTNLTFDDVLLGDIASDGLFKL